MISPGCNSASGDQWCWSPPKSFAESSAHPLKIKASPSLTVYLAFSPSIWGTSLFGPDQTSACGFVGAMFVTSMVSVSSVVAPSSSITVTPIVKGPSESGVTVHRNPTCPSSHGKCHCISIGASWFSVSMSPLSSTSKVTGESTGTED